MAQLSINKQTVTVVGDWLSRTSQYPLDNCTMKRFRRVNLGCSQTLLVPAMPVSRHGTGECSMKLPDSKQKQLCSTMSTPCLTMLVSFSEWDICCCLEYRESHMTPTQCVHSRYTDVSGGGWLCCTHVCVDKVEGSLLLTCIAVLRFL